MINNKFQEDLQNAIDTRSLKAFKVLINEHDLLPPPWMVFPELHPASIGWRMGFGEDFISLWNNWWESKNYSEPEATAYFCRFKPPHAWLEWVIFTLWSDIQEDYFDLLEEDEDQANELLKPYFQKLEILGFGDFKDWLKDYEREDWD